MDTNTINKVLTITEAAETWNKSVSTLRRVIHGGKFKEGIDFRKSGSTWIITKESMLRVYGIPYKRRNDDNE